MNEDSESEELFYPPQIITPEFVDVTCKNKAITGVLVTIPPEIFQKVIEFSNCYYANEKCGCNYNKGLNNTIEDPVKVTRTGLIGEVALAMLFHLGVDVKYKKGGAEYDFPFKNKKIEMKTASKNRHEQGLIMAITDGRKNIELVSDIYFFGYIVQDDFLTNKENKEGKVMLVGGRRNKNISRTTYDSKMAKSNHKKLSSRLSRINPNETVLRNFN